VIFLGKTKKRINKDIIEILTSHIVAITLGMIGGIILLSAQKKFDIIPSLLILLPGYLETHGNLLGTLAGRISTGLQTKHISTTNEHTTYIKENIYATFTLGIITSLVLGLLAAGAHWLFFNHLDINIIFISVIALAISLIIEIPLTIMATYWFYHHHYNPDDIMGPYVTTLGDIIGILSLVISIGILT